MFFYFYKALIMIMFPFCWLFCGVFSPQTMEIKCLANGGWRGASPMIFLYETHTTLLLTPLELVISFRPLCYQVLYYD